MPKLGSKSEARISQVDLRLQKIFRRVILGIDFTVLKDGGQRTRERQAELVAKGVSKTMLSKHLLGLALDIAPWWTRKPHVRWPDEEGISQAEREERIKRWFILAGYVRAIADQMDLDIIGGHDWNMNYEFTDQTWHDWPHWEITGDQ